MPASSQTVACKQCGALNEADFGSCIRCGQALAGAAPAQKAKRRVPARRVPARASMATGPGTEPLLGKYPAADLPAAKLILFLNLVVFTSQVFSVLSHSPGLGALFTGGGLEDATRFGALPIGSIGIHGNLNPFVFIAEPWRFLTACYVHAGIIHVGMNMYGLVYFAKLAEPAIGSVRFIIAYTLTGIGGYLASLLIYMLGGEPTFTLGASGAVFGIMGLILGFLWRRRDPRWKPWLLRMVIGSLVISFLLPIGINHTAHLGGLISGTAIGALFAPGAPRPSFTWQRYFAALCVLVTLGSLLAVRFSPYAQIAF